MVNDLELLASNLPPLTLAQILVDLEDVKNPDEGWHLRARLAFRGALLANVGPEEAADLIRKVSQ